MMFRMDMKAYISSGIIEDFCLGILKEDEKNAVLQQARVYPEIKQEIETFMLALEQYAVDTSFNPSEHLKEQTMQLLSNLTLEEEKKIFINFRY